MAKTPETATKSDRHRLSWLRGTIIGLLIGLGSVAFGGYVVVHWAERQVLNTDNWVALVGPLPKQPIVSDTLGSYISDQVFAAVPVQKKIEDALPPRASFLAGPLASQLQSLTTKTAQHVVAGDRFQTVWTSANRLAMNRLLAIGREGKTPLQERAEQKFNINLSGTSGQLSSALGKAGSAIPALQPATSKAVNVSADLHTRRERLHTYIRAIDFLAAVLPLFVLTSLLWALALAHQRRRTVIATAITVGALMLVELIALKGLRQEVLGQVRNPGNTAAIGYVYDTLTGWLRHMMYAVLVGVVVILIVCVLAGPSAWAITLRSYVRLDRLKQSLPLTWWRAVRAWVGRYQYYAWLGVVLVVLAYLALFVAVSWRVALNAALSTLGLFALIHIVGTPRLGQSEQTAVVTTR